MGTSKDGQIVWHAQCQHCGWKDPDYSTDLKVSEAHAAAHLAAEHSRIRVPVTLGPDWKPGLCMALWSEQIACPNQATWRVENTTNEGFAEMCTLHKEGFAEFQPTALVRYIALDEASYAP